MDASGAWEAPRIGTAGPGTFVVTVERDGKEPFSVSKFVRCHLSPPVISELRVTPSRFPINQYSPVRINLSISRYSIVRFWVRRAEPPRKGLAPPNESRSFTDGLRWPALPRERPAVLPRPIVRRLLHDLPLRPGRYTLTARARGFARSKPSERVSTTFKSCAIGPNGRAIPDPDPVAIGGERVSYRPGLAQLEAAGRPERRTSAGYGFPSPPAAAPQSRPTRRTAGSNAVRWTEAE